MYLYITIKNEFVEVTSNGSTMKLISLIRTVQRLIQIQKKVKGSNIQGTGNKFVEDDAGLVLIV